MLTHAPPLPAPPAPMIVESAPRLADRPRYAGLLSAFRPCVDLVLSGLTARDATDATRRLFRTLQAGAFLTGRVEKMIPRNRGKRMGKRHVGNCWQTFGYLW